MLFRSTLQSIWDEAKDLAETLKHVVDMVERELQQYSPELPEEGNLDKERSWSRDFHERVKTLERCALSHIVSTREVASLIDSKLHDVCKLADKLEKKTSWCRFLYSSQDAETLLEMKEKMSMAHRCYGVSCRGHPSLCAIVYPVSMSEG